jgi:hypothetical protein
MKKEMMRWRRNLFRVFYPRQVCFIYKHIVTGLRENKAHKIFTKELNSAHKQTIIKRISKKVRETSPWTRGLMTSMEKEKVMSVLGRIYIH